MPGDVKRGELREELHRTVGQVIVNPLGHSLPGRAALVSIGEPRDHNACRRAHAAFGVPVVEYVSCIVGLIRGAAQVLFISGPVHVSGPKICVFRRA